MIRLWTDGCCLKNPGGTGGWAFVAEDKGSTRAIAADSGGEASTTNNRMELAAVVEALLWAEDRSHEQIEVWSDSKYVVEGANTWRHIWKKHGWRKKAGSPKQVKNADQWERIDELAGDVIRFVWIKGHAGANFNEQADHLACQAAESEARNPDDPLTQLDQALEGVA